MMATSLNRSFEIGGAEVRAGERATIPVPLVPLYTHAGMSMPVHVVHGRRPGPRLFVCGGVHGDEIVGVEIVRRLIRLKKIGSLRGTLLAVPVVNLYGFIHQSRYLPDRRDLNRFFPGSGKGSLTSQLADIFMQEVVSRSTHGIDLHAGSNHRINLPQVRAEIEDPETRRLALAFKVPLVMRAAPRDNSLREAAAERGVPMLVYEGGEALRIDETSVRAGLRGILHVMGALGMLPTSMTGKSSLQPLIAERTSWVRSPASGLFHSRARLGGYVRRGQKLGTVADPLGTQEFDVVSNESGMILGRLNLPLVHRGDAIFHIAHFDQPSAVQPLFDDFQEEIAATLSDRE